MRVASRAEGHTCIHEPGLRAVRSAARFDGPIRDALHALTSRRDLGLAEAMAQVLLEAWRKLDWRVDESVPVPRGAKRLRERGYNQAALLAHAFGQKINVPASEKLLVRSRETATPVGLSLVECHLNVAGAFRAQEVTRRTILLLDDVCTTGATLEAGAHALVEAGAQAAFAMRVARAASPFTPQVPPPVVFRPTGGCPRPHAEVMMTLQVEIQGHDMEVTASLDEYVRKKAARLDRYLDALDEARVELLHVKSARSAADRQIAQITVRGPNVLLRAEERSDDMFAAVDAAVDKLQRRLERYKGKRHRGRGDGTPAARVGPAERAEREAPSGSRIVRRKAFELVPMSEEDAIEQMEMLGHDSFFVFLNLHSNQVNVLYRRRDGTYGLIDTRTR